MHMQQAYKDFILFVTVSVKIRVPHSYLNTEISLLHLGWNQIMYD